MSSTSGETYFHWLIFDDSEIKQVLGGDDSICFRETDGELVCTNLTLRINSPALVDTARSILLEHLSTVGSKQ